MVSNVYNSCIVDMAHGRLDYSLDIFKVMLVTEKYAFDQRGHRRRSDVQHEAVGTGYTSGGAVVRVFISAPEDIEGVAIEFGSAEWTRASVVARGCVVYKSRGGLPTDDELVAFVDFGKDVASTDAAFTVSFSAPLTFRT